MSKKWVGRWVKWVSHKKHRGKGGTHRGLMGDAGVLIGIGPETAG